MNRDHQYLQMLPVDHTLSLSISFEHRFLPRSNNETHLRLDLSREPTMRSFMAILVLLSLFSTLPAWAAKPSTEVLPTTVGKSHVLDIRPDLADAVEEVRGRFVWREIVYRREATFAKPHFVDVNLRVNESRIGGQPS